MKNGGVSRPSWKPTLRACVVLMPTFRSSSMITMPNHLMCHPLPSTPPTPSPHCELPANPANVSRTCPTISSLVLIRRISPPPNRTLRTATKPMMRKSMHLDCRCIHLLTHLLLKTVMLVQVLSPTGPVEVRQKSQSMNDFQQWCADQGHLEPASLDQSCWPQSPSIDSSNKDKSPLSRAVIDNFHPPYLAPLPDLPSPSTLIEFTLHNFNSDAKSPTPITLSVDQTSRLHQNSS